jgi:hypothetical protein
MGTKPVRWLPVAGRTPATGRIPVTGRRMYWKDSSVWGDAPGNACCILARCRRSTAVTHAGRTEPFTSQDGPRRLRTPTLRGPARSRARAAAPGAPADGARQHLPSGAASYIPGIAGPGGGARTGEGASCSLVAAKRRCTASSPIRSSRSWARGCAAVCGAVWRTAVTG